MTEYQIKMKELSTKSQSYVF